LVPCFHPSACAGAMAAAIAPDDRRPTTDDVPSHHVLPFGFLALRTVLLPNRF